jgi:hypothetical protein
VSSSNPHLLNGAFSTLVTFVLWSVLGHVHAVMMINEFEMIVSEFDLTNCVVDLTAQEFELTQNQFHVTNHNCDLTLRNVMRQIQL